MEAGVMEERDVLKEKLHITLDCWTLDKIMLKEKAAREFRLKEAEQSYEIARREMRLGSQQQQLLVLKLKLDSALEDIELKEIQVSALQSLLQEERKWLHSANKKLQDTKASFSKKLASKGSKLALETERKIHHLQQILDDRARSHKAEIEHIKSKHALAVTELKEEIKQLISRDDYMKAKQSEWTLERKELQALLVQEKNNLRAEQEQWQKDKKELHALLQEKRNLSGELEKWKSQQKEVQAVIDERDRLIAEKARFISLEQEVIELVKERDILNAQLEHYMSQGDDIHELVKERDKLKDGLDQSIFQRHEEVRALVRERDFVWSQMKNLDEDYGKRIKKMSNQNLQDRQEIERLSNELKGSQVCLNEMMVEMTILKLEAKRVEDLAIQKQHAFEAELQVLRSTLEKVEEEKQTLIADALKREPRLLELATRTETLERQLDCPYQDQGSREVPDGPKEGPEVLNAGDGITLDHEILESQIEQATQVQRNDEKLSTKSVEDLRRENENLRRDTENLRTLYAELEEALPKKQKKPAKVTNKANHRDPTSRNLKLELEAAANRSPLHESPITDGNTRKKGKERHPGNQKGVSDSTQKKKKDSSKKSYPDGDHSSEYVEGSKRTTRSSKGISSANSKHPSDESVMVPSPKNLRPRSRVDYSDALNIAVDQNDRDPVKKRRRKVNNGDFESIQDARPPLQTLPHNQRSSTKSAVRPLSSSRGLLPESAKKTFMGSPTKTSKMMANLFSTAFSVPKLKTVQTPSHFTTGEVPGKGGQ